MGHETEFTTEAIAEVLAKESKTGMPAMMFLGQAYQLLFFGDRKELSRVKAKISKAKRSKISAMERATK